MDRRLSPFHPYFPRPYFPFRLTRSPTRWNMGLERNALSPPSPFLKGGYRAVGTDAPNGRLTDLV